jgi:aspartyl-tRNA(Asn)/glutamyl-tRNA(Gln) amidotransferase subunit A
MSGAPNAFAAPLLSELHALDADGLVALFRTGELTPVDAYEVAFARMSLLEPHINAMTHVNAAGRAEAEASARRWREGKARGPLDGVPVTLKDNLAAAGMPATFASPAYRSFIPDHDELPVARVRQAGAVVLGKTNLPEFALEGFTDNALFGATGNPWNPALTPGGSTGGGAASVAAGYVPVALGTDAAGSLRRPAAHCGLVGLKTSIGRIPRRGGLPQLVLDFEVAGALTRTMRDTRTLYEVMSGPDTAVAASLSVPDPSPRNEPLRILAVERLGQSPLDPNIARSFRALVDQLAGAGHHVDRGQLPQSAEALAAFWPDIGRAHLARLFEERPEIRAAASSKYVGMADEGACLSAARMLAILECVATIRNEAAVMFQSHDVVVTPTIAALAWPKGSSHPTEIDGTPVGPRGHAVYTGWVNAAGLPALALPVEPAPDGRQIGVQLVAAFGADRLLLALGEQIVSRGEAFSRPAPPWSASRRIEGSRL